MDDHYLTEREDQKVLIVMTSGPSTPQRCATPFYLGSILAAMDADVSIFFTMEGVNLVKKDVAPDLVAMEGGKSILQFIRDAKSAGVKLHLCMPALPGYDIDPERDIIDEVDDVVGGGVLADLILTADKVITF